MARLYTKKIWFNDQTKLSAKNLNHIEKGVEAVADAIDELEAKTEEIRDYVDAASSAVSTHNTSSTAHSDIRTLVSNAQTAADNAQTKANEIEELIVNGVIDGSPKDVYPDLSALQTAYPSGAIGVYITSDNGHWYYWNGSAWTDGGVYQSSEDVKKLKEDLDNTTGLSCMCDLNTTYPTFTLNKPIPAGTKIYFYYKNIDITQNWHQFSFKDSNGTNINTYIMPTSGGSDSIVLESDAYSIGFALATTQTDGLFACYTADCAFEFVYKTVDDIGKHHLQTVIPKGQFDIFSLYDVIPAGTIINFEWENITVSGNWHQFSFKDNSDVNLNTYVMQTQSGSDSIILLSDAYKIGFALEPASNNAKFSISWYDGIKEEIRQLKIADQDTNRRIDNILVSQDNKCRPVIWDCDNGWDIDDCIAGRILAWGVRTGAIDLMGVVLSCNNGTNSVSAIDGLLCAEGIGTCKIGAYPYTTHSFTKGYHTILANYPKHYQDENDAITDVALYRKALAQLPDGIKADVVITGYTNSFSRFLQSSADSDSPLTGLQLAHSKIRRLWIMGGDYDTGNPELNFKTYPDDTAYILANYTGDIYFQGFEIGINIQCAENVEQITDSNDLLYKCVSNWYTEQGKTYANAYDPMVLLAMIDNNDFVTCLDYKRGVVSFDTTTLRTSFTENASGNHYVASVVLDYGEYTNRINNLLNKYIFPSLSNSIYRLK